MNFYREETLRDVLHKIFAKACSLSIAIFLIFSPVKKVNAQELRVLEGFDYEPIQNTYSCAHAEIIEKNLIKLTQKEATALMKIAKAENGNADAYGQALIMLVVLNRVKSNKFPNSVMGVVSQPRQFTTYFNGRYKKSVPDSTSHEALALLESELIECKALYFEASWLKNSWQSKHRRLLFEYAGTRYYR